MKFIFTAEYELFRELLVAARKDAGMTQADLAARLGVGRDVISKIETGIRRLDVIEYLHVAAAVGYDPLALLQQVVEQIEVPSK